MATARQLQAARRNLERAREVRRQRAHDEPGSDAGEGLSAGEKDRLPDRQFAFPDERKEPLHDAAHVRNAIARFDQVKGVSDAERDRAWTRVVVAAKTFGVEVSVGDWRELPEGAKSKKR